MRMRLVLATAAVVLLLGQTARAQSPEEKAAAGEHFAKAEAHMEAAEYDDAIREYQAAYDAVPKPGFYYNIGRAYELKGDKEHAHEYFLKYLELAPDGRAAEEARTRAVTLEHAIAEEARALEAEKEKPPEEEKAPPPEIPAEKPVVVPPDKDDVSRPGGGYKIAGVSVGAAGVILLGVAVYQGLEVSSAEDDLAPYYSGEKVWDDAADDLEQKADDASTRANVLYGVGAVAVVGGAVLYYVGWNKGRSGSGGVAVVPRVEGGLAVTWACEF